MNLFYVNQANEVKDNFVPGKVNINFNVYGALMLNEIRCHIHNVECNKMLSQYTIIDFVLLTKDCVYNIFLQPGFPLCVISPPH